MILELRIAILSKWELVRHLRPETVQNGCFRNKTVVGWVATCPQRRQLATGAGVRAAVKAMVGPATTEMATAGTEMIDRLQASHAHFDKGAV